MTVRQGLDLERLVLLSLAGVAATVFLGYKTLQVINGATDSSEKQAARKRQREIFQKLKVLLIDWDNFVVEAQ